MEPNFARPDFSFIAMEPINARPVFPAMEPDFALPESIFNNFQCPKLNITKSSTLDDIIFQTEKFFKHFSTISKQSNLINKMNILAIKVNKIIDFKTFNKHVNDIYQTQNDIKNDGFDNSNYTNYPDDDEMKRWRKNTKQVKLQDIKILSPNLKDLSEYIHTTKLCSWRSKSSLESMLKIFNSVWHMDWFSNQCKNVAIKFMCGFDDIINTKDFKTVYEEKKEYTIYNKKIQLYIDEEIKANRIIEIPSYGHVLSTNNYRAISAKILMIEEAKLDSNNEQYTKTRYVYNNIQSNKLISYSKFRMPCVFTLFHNNNLFKLVNSSDKVTVLDRRNYYRQWFVGRNSIKLSLIMVVGIDDNGKKMKRRNFLDLAGRMGANSSSLHAQLLSDTVDTIFNNLHAPAYAITLQDDSIIFRCTNDTAENYLSLSKNLSLDINQQKSQINVATAVWAGYNIKFKSKMVSLKITRLQKLEATVHEIINQKSSKRRTYARFLGQVYSSRVIIIANRIWLAPLLSSFRQKTYLFNQFYDMDRISQDDEFYETMIEYDNNLTPEILLTMNILNREVSFKSIRAGMNRRMELNHLNFNNHTKNIKLFTDSSLQAYGVYIIINHDNEPHYFGLSGLFGKKFDNWSINCKEMFALLLGQILAIHIHKSRFNKNANESHIILAYTDNETSRMVAATQRTNLKSRRLAILSKIQIALDISFTQYITRFARIPTQQNIPADLLSRNMKLVMASEIVTEFLSPLLLIGCNLQTDDSL